MAYEFTFTPRFQKHFKGLNAQEKKQLKNKLELLAENPSHLIIESHLLTRKATNSLSLQLPKEKKAHRSCLLPLR